MRYMTDDNKVFNTLDEAKKHEEAVREEKEKQNKLAAEKKKRYEEVESAWENYRKIARKYAEDYRDTDEARISDMWDRFFKGILS